MPWTKVPNIFLDRLLARLTDTETRVLLVLLRRTAGWGRPGEEVMFSYRDLQRSTGRQSEAIARALKSLERRGLIHRPVPGMKRSIDFAAFAASETEDQQKHRKRIKTMPGHGVIPKPRQNRNHRAGGREHFSPPERGP